MKIVGKTEEDRTFIHVAKKEIRKDLIGYDEQGNCGRCHGPLENGFGMAGGGFGPYAYCPKCEKVVDKIEDPT